MPPLTGWDHYKDITGESASVVGTHTDMPLCIHLSSDADIRAGMAEDGRDIRFTSTDNLTDYPFELVAEGHILTPDGCRTWFSSPQQTYDATANKSWVPCCSGGRWVKVTQIDHATNTWRTYPVVQLSEEDDHDNGAVIVRSDGKLIYFYGLHADAASLKWAISNNAYDASAWTTQTPRDPNVVATEAGEYSYSNLARLSAEGTIGRIYNFYRFNSTAGDRRWCYIYTDDDGATWSAAQELWTGTVGSGTPYLVLYSNGVDRIDFAVSNAHPNDGSVNKYVGHFYMTGGSFYKTDGTLIGSSPPLNSTHVTQVYLGTTQKAWLDQIIHDGTNPRILLKEYPLGDNTDHRYRYAVWGGSSWSSVDITGAHVGTTPDTTSFDTSYDGCCCFDPDDPDTVYLAQMVSGTYEIQKWETSDGGATFSKTADITSGSAAHNFRPHVGKGMVGKRGRLTWLGNGKYTSYEDFDTAIRCYPPLDHLAAYAYVKVPSVTSSGDFDVRVHYGNAAATDDQDVSGCWSGFTLVAHGLPKPKQHKDNIASVGSLAITDLVRGEVWHEAPGPSGIRVNLENGTQNRATGSVLNLSGWSGFTVSGWFRCDTTTTNEQQFVNLWTGASNAGFMLRKKSSSTTPQAYVSLEANTQVGGDMSSVTIPDDTPFQLVMAGRNSSGWSHWVRINTSQSSAATGGTANFDATAGTVNLGVGAYAASPSTTYLRGAFARILIPTNTFRSKDWSDTQYAFADGETAWTFGAEDGGGTAYTLTADPGAMPITGTAANLLYGRRLSAESGSLPISGTAASLLYGRILTAESGSVPITGTDADLVYTQPGDYVLTANPGALPISGTAAGLYYNRRLSADSGSVPIEGTAATLTYLRTYTLIAESGSVPIVGTAATLVYSGAVAVVPDRGDVWTFADRVATWRVR